MDGELIWNTNPHSAELPDVHDVDVDIDAVGTALVDVYGPRLATLGLAFDDLTWRDTARRWPDHVVMGRDNATAPDSVGMSARGATHELGVVVYAGGWADVLIGMASEFRQGLGYFTTTSGALAVIETAVSLLEQSDI